MYAAEVITKESGTLRVFETKNEGLAWLREETAKHDNCNAEIWNLESTDSRRGKDRGKKK